MVLIGTESACLWQTLRHKSCTVLKHVSAFRIWGSNRFPKVRLVQSACIRFTMGLTRQFHCCLVQRFGA